MSRTGFCEAQLIERTVFSEDLWQCRFRPEGSLSFRAGQYATIAVQDGDKLIQRPYSIVSSPYESFLEFFIELVPSGELTPRLWDLRLGDRVLIRNRIVGAFVLDEKTGFTRHLMAATVTGAAPFISMARTQRFEMQKGKSDIHQMAIIHGASQSYEFGVYREELEDIAREGWLTYIPTVSRPWEDTEWAGQTGRVEDLIRQYLDELGFDHNNSVGYACGHPEMIENVKGILRRARFRKEQIKEEKYFTSPASSERTGHP